MFVSFILVYLAISSPITAQASVVRERNSSCSINEFSCADGSCVSPTLICDGYSDCLDGSDENYCYSQSNSSSHPYDLVINRFRRQSGCGKAKWQCRDGSCISFEGKCDGIVNCKDKSDETHALCRLNKCQPNWFRCTYGACVDGTAPCNGIQECADNSDELLPRCKRDTRQTNKNVFVCKSGGSIPSTDLCDGKRDCQDGSDETIAACADKKCFPHLFQCAYGACVDNGADCDGKIDCADGSDEADELCISNQNPANSQIPNRNGLGSNKCMLPQYPEHGTYTVPKVANAAPGWEFQSVTLKITCNRGYGVLGSSTVKCEDNSWQPETLPKCVPFCKLKTQPEVKFACLLDGDFKGERSCKAEEPPGTTVRPECQLDYYSSTPLLNMHCYEDGSWDRSPVCIPECGRLTPTGTGLAWGAREAIRGELPWHVGIYSKEKGPYKQVCGGSLVSKKVVISAAHCFWRNSERLPDAFFAVAVGKLYREWDHNEDRDAQKFKITSIKIPPRFRGVKTNFQEDIAMVTLDSVVVYKSYVMPICLDFKVNFDTKALEPGKLGKVAGWGLISKNGPPSDILLTVKLPVVDIHECIRILPDTFTQNISADKICAGYNNGTAAVCEGDSGGGLAFPSDEHGVIRYYLRGIVSTAPTTENECNVDSFTTFTHILKQEHFITDHL